MSKPRLYLIDATAFCYRAFYALPGLATSFGQPTNAIYGFINILNKILKKEKPDYIAACFDISRDTFRQKKFAEYKINRPPMPDGLKSQIPLIKEVIIAYGIKILEKEGFEADDIIATVAQKANKTGFSTVIVSSDKDILQLVDQDTTVFSPYKDEGVYYDEKKVIERFGIKPEKIADLIALMGDDVDNIPGVSGIGEKTASSLIASFGSLRELVNNIDNLKQEKTRKAIVDNLTQVKLNMELALLDKDIDLDLDFKELKIKEPNYQELFRLFKQLEFKKLLKELPGNDAQAQEIKVEDIKESDLRDAIGNLKELIIHGISADNLTLCANNKFLHLSSSGDSLKAILEDDSIKKIGHDLKKIKVSLAKEGINLGGEHFDTMIAAYLINPSKADYSLAEVAWDHLGVLLDAKAAYNPQHIDIIRKLLPKLSDELQEKSLFSLFTDLEMPLVRVLAEMELSGIKLDLMLMRCLSRDIEKRLIKLIEDIYEASQTQFNINSPKQLREILFEKLKLPVVKKSKTGPSTDEEVLRALAGKHKLPAMLLEYRQLMKLKTTYVDILPELADKKTGKIHTSFNQAATETGRLSSSNPNLQNIPVKTEIGKNIRKAIIASDEKSCLLSCDYSQIELRVLAHITGDENLTLAFKENKDIHKATASLIYGLSETDITDAMRDVAKRVNFGIIYGLTSYGLSRDLGISLDSAQGFINAYFLRYPKVNEYIEAQIKRAEKDGFVTTILGRRRYLPEITNKNQGIRQFAQRQAVNTPIQGSAADLIKLAMLKIHKHILENKLEARMALQIHDELVFDVSKDELSGLINLAKDSMENVLKLNVPLRVDIKKGMNWLEMEEVSH